MNKGRVCGLSSLILIVSILGIFLPAETSCKKRKSAFYKGIQQKPIISRSYITSAVTEYKFDSALQGDRLEHEFIFRNNREKPLLIKKIKAG